MNEKDLENLVRMAAEIDELEHAARTFESLGDITPSTIRFDRRRRRQPVWQLGVFAAAAAAALLVALLPTTTDQQPSSAFASSFQIDYCPAVPRYDGVRIDHFEHSSSEQCAVLAIFNTWEKDCQCLAWQLYEWEDGRALAELSPDEVHRITIDVTDAPPIEQLLLVAIAKNPSDLPGDETQTYELLDCLNEVAPPTDPRESAAAYASAVRSCLPDTVTVVPQPFFVD
ncbi:MAG: hypothetical protein KKI02_12425 [Planctomycetes bacterium]|nr:hypothetical protein [Planctomycetota bacterium]